MGCSQTGTEAFVSIEALEASATVKAAPAPPPAPKYFPSDTPIGRIRSLIWNLRSTYHVFEYRGRRILYDVAAGRTLEIDPAAFGLLHGIERGQSDEEIERECALAGCEDENFLDLLGEVAALYDAGLFRLESLDSKEKREQTLNSLLEHHPNKMMLLVQTSCNLKCHYCYEVQSDFHSTGNRMDFETAKRSVDHLIERAGPRKDLEITFFGGEPLLNFSLIQQVVEYCDELGQQLGKKFYYLMTTNAVLLNEEMIDFVVKHDFGIMVSIDGAPEDHDIHRVDHRGKGTGTKAVENAVRLVAAQRRAGVRTAKVRATLTKQNWDPVKAANYFHSKGFSRMDLGSSHGTAFEKKAWDISGEEVIEKIRDKYEGLLDEFLDALENGKPFPPGQPFVQVVQMIHEALAHPRERAQIRCGVARNMQAITDKGSIYPCHRYAGMEAYKLGSLETGIDNEKVAGYYQQILDGYDKHCSSCWARFYCGGQCPWYLSQPNGQLTTPDEESCDGIRRGEERAIWLYHELRERFPEFLAKIIKEEK